MRRVSVGGQDDLEQPLAPNHRGGNRLNRAESVRGRASDIREARRTRLLNENQVQVCKFICPFILLGITFVSICSFYVFSADSGAIKHVLDGSSVYAAGLALQIWYIIMLTRDTLLALTAFRSQQSEAIYLVPIMHCLCSCMDVFILLGFVIWATVAVDPTLIEQCKALPDETGAAGFIKATRANIVIGWLYLILHCCACPIFLCLATCCDYAPPFLRPRRNRANRQDEEFVRERDDGFYNGDGSQVRREQEASNAMEGLNVGNFGSIASSMVKTDDEFSCAICITPFGNHDDVTELTCSNKHIFHTECLKPWLERNLNCPCCRTPVSGQ